MTDPHKMDRSEVLVARLKVLKLEHRDLDAAIHALGENAGADMLTVRRMKKPSTFVQV